MNKAQNVKRLCNALTGKLCGLLEGGKASHTEGRGVELVSAANSPGDTGRSFLSSGLSFPKRRVRMESRRCVGVPQRLPALAGGERGGRGPSEPLASACSLRPPGCADHTLTSTSVSSVHRAMTCGSSSANLTRIWQQKCSVV